MDKPGARGGAADSVLLRLAGAEPLSRIPAVAAAAISTASATTRRKASAATCSSAAPTSRPAGSPAPAPPARISARPSSSPPPPPPDGGFRPLPGCSAAAGDPLAPRAAGVGRFDDSSVSPPARQGRAIAHSDTAADSRGRSAPVEGAVAGPGPSRRDSSAAGAGPARACERSRCAGSASRRPSPHCEAGSAPLARAAGSAPPAGGLDPAAAGLA